MPKEEGRLSREVSVVEEGNFPDLDRGGQGHPAGCKRPKCSTVRGEGGLESGARRRAEFQAQFPQYCMRNVPNGTEIA